MYAELEQLSNTGDTAPGEPLLPAAVQASAATAEPGPQALARLIEYAEGRYIALPPHTTYALIENPAIVGVPGAAHHAYGLLTWQGTRLPMLNIHALMHPGASATPASPPHYALVVAYQSAARAPLAYGAIGMDKLPQTIAVGDEAQCELPNDNERWQQIALCCFQHEGQAVPIIDTARLFAVGHG